MTLNKANIEQLVHSIDTDIVKLINPQDYRQIINRNNLLFGFDTLNKILIKIQNINAFDVRTPVEWKMLGRELKQDATEIALFSKDVSVKYFDTLTHKEIALSESDLTPEELRQAISNKIIERRVESSGNKIDTVYDVRSTISTDGQKYKLNRPKANVNNLLSTASKFLGVELKLSTNTRISNLDKTYYIKNEPFENMVINVAKIITNDVLDKRLRKIIADNNIKLDIHDENVKRFLYDSLMYSICSMFKVEYKCDFFNYYYLKDNGVLSIIIIIDTVGNELQSLTNYILPIESVGSVNNIAKVKRAEELWGMITAFDLMNKMKGTY